MKISKILICLFIPCIVMTLFTTSAFAETADDMRRASNAMAVVIVDNEDCLEIPNLGDLSLQVTAPGTEIDITIPVEKVEYKGETLGFWLGYPKDRISDAIMEELAEVQGKVELGDYEKDPVKFFTEIDRILSKFNVAITGLPKKHYSSTSGCIVLTQDIFRQIVDMSKDMIDGETSGFDSFASMIDAVLLEEGVSLEELQKTMDDADGEAVKNLIENLDPLLAYITSAEFSGILIAGAQLSCACPSIEYFQIIHKYYERTNGKLKLLATVYEGSHSDEYEGKCLKGYAGDTITADRYVNCQYQGQAFEYMGSYDSYALYDGNRWSQYEKASFQLGDWETDGLVLRYVMDTEEAAAADKGPAPDTGDRPSLGIYIVLLFTALGASGAIAGYHKKK